MSTTIESHQAPIHIHAIGLRAKDMEGLARFYEEGIGMERLEANADHVVLGTDGVGYLRILNAPHAEPEGARAAGLFHTAFLLPSRAALGRWFKRAHDRGIPFDGASDHGVSEAFYLSDPEGNGIEVYADRPRSEWQAEGAGWHMTTDSMDVAGVVRAGVESGAGNGRFPDQTRIGHVHLKVGDAAEAEQFYANTLGFDVTHRRAPHAGFFSSGGYHHHIAANTWGSRGAGARVASATGLDHVELAVRNDDDMQALADRISNAGGAGGETLAHINDPWANKLLFRRLDQAQA